MHKQKMFAQDESLRGTTRIYVDITIHASSAPIDA